ncbi:hypothetical protein E4T56_gene12658 [Termitomyces sp. T112]|nr:hypothetical protein E4T56_gene12658 [Termitomyces sp. T112]
MRNGANTVIAAISNGSIFQRQNSDKFLFCSTICEIIRRVHAKNDSDFVLDPSQSFPSSGTRVEARKSETELEKLQHDPKILLKANTAWWLRMNVVLEMITEDEDTLNSLTRLMGGYSESSLTVGLSLGS